MSAADIVIIGGTSRLGRALLARQPGIRVIARRPTNDSGPQTIVEDYHAVTPDMLAGATSIISVVGTTQGTAAELEKANVTLAEQLATAAKTAGAQQFIYISSFSVYGDDDCPEIGKETAVDPRSDYGRSKCHGERILSALRDDAFTPVSVRFPSLYGSDDGKLAQLVAIWTRFRLFPAPQRPTRRSFMSYDNAAAFLLGPTVASTTSPFAPALLVAADPEAFVHDRACDTIKSATGRSVGCLRLPLMEAMTSRIAPGLHASLFQSSFLDPPANAARDMTSTLYHDIAEMALRGANLR